MLSHGRCYTKHNWIMFVYCFACFVFRWESPIAYSAQPLCWSDWEKPPSPTTRKGAVRKDGDELPWGWSLPECFTSSGGLQLPPLFLIIQRKRQRHLTWTATHDVVSWKNYLWKGFDLLLGPNLWPVTPSAGCLTARPPELAELNYNNWTLINTGTIERGFWCLKINSFHKHFEAWILIRPTIVSDLDLEDG